MARWLASVRVLQGLDQHEFSQYIGRSRSALTMYEQGERVIPIEVIAAILTNFPGTPPPPTGGIEVVGQALPEDRKAYITYAGVVPCSKDWGDPLESQDRRSIDPEFAGANRFLCRVAGDSCYPALIEGDLTVWESDDNPAWGLIVLAQRTTDSACTVKQLVWDEALQRAILRPINPERQAPDDSDGWRVIARMIGVMRNTDGPPKQWGPWPAGLRPEHLS